MSREDEMRNRTFVEYKDGDGSPGKQIKIGDKVRAKTISGKVMDVVVRNFTADKGKYWMFSGQDKDGKNRWFYGKDIVEILVPFEKEETAPEVPETTEESVPAAKSEIAGKKAEEVIVDEVPEKKKYCKTCKKKVNEVKDSDGYFCMNCEEHKTPDEVFERTSKK